MTLNKKEHIYNIGTSYDFDKYISLDMNNKLLCTFTNLDSLDNLISDLSNTYTIIYDKIFVLYIKSTDEFVITYNIEQNNINDIPLNTILVHRKKEFNTLYTINALNDLIKKLNGGVVDTKFQINWQHYKNCILLTNNNELKQLNTKIYKIINL